MIRPLLRLARPLPVLLSALTYALGVGIANYLGEPLQAVRFVLGLILVLLSEIGLNLLAEVFRPPNEPISAGETPAERRRSRNNALPLSIAALAGIGLVIYLLFAGADVPVPALVMLAISLVIVLTYGVPPFRLLDRGFGEFLHAAHLAYVIPSISFLLQAQDSHRLLGLVAVPLTAIAFAYFIVLDFPAFASDQKYERRTLLTLVGWQRAIAIHHALVVSAYFLFASAPFLQVLWPVFITLPFAIFQIMYLNSIGAGAPPNWTLLTVNALAVFGLNTYLLTMVLWLR
jgi:1,4-dihydroxy-2-naphthoate octaprenyltransferase